MCSRDPGSSRKVDTNEMLCRLPLVQAEGSIVVLGHLKMSEVGGNGGRGLRPEAGKSFPGGDRRGLILTEKEESKDLRVLT